MNNNAIIDLRVLTVEAKHDSYAKAMKTFKDDDLILRTSSTMLTDYGEIVEYFNQDLVMLDYDEDVDDSEEVEVVKADGGIVIPTCYESYKEDFCDDLSGDLYIAYMTFIDDIATRMVNLGIIDTETQMTWYENEVNTVYISTINATDNKYLQVYLGMIEGFLQNVCDFRKGAVLTTLSMEEYKKFRSVYLGCNWRIIPMDGCYLAYYEHNTEEFYK